MSGTGTHYLTKNELRRILEEIDIGSIRQQVFALYGLQPSSGVNVFSGKACEAEQRTLMKAYYTYMSDRHFVE